MTAVRGHAAGAALLLVLGMYAAAVAAAAAADPAPLSPAPAVLGSSWREQDRPGGAFSQTCGHAGMSVCDDTCVDTESQPPEWCPKNPTSDGCMQGLTKVFITPSTSLDDKMPDLCLAQPKVGTECGVAGAPCCLQPQAGDPSTFARPMCSAGLSCMISDPVTALPYGGTKHMAAVLKHPESTGLLAGELMGTCRSTAPVHEAEADPAGNTRLAVNSVLGECGAGRLRCPAGTYCAANGDHLLGGARCVPMPECGGDYQQCCPAYSNGEPGVPSIVDKRTAVPTCTTSDAVCVWKSRLEGFDPSTDHEAVQLLTPPGSTSMAIQFPQTMCIPNLARCGEAGQPCCPHAQFAMSNTPMYFRLHVCDPGLRCDATISVFNSVTGSRPVLGVCRGVEETLCGALGQECCSHTDQAGWEWRTCANGEPGVFCGPDNVCARCPLSTQREAGMSQAALAALALPGVGNTC